MLSLRLRTPPPGESPISLDRQPAVATSHRKVTLPLVREECSLDIDCRRAASLPPDNANSKFRKASLASHGSQGRLNACRCQYKVFTLECTCGTRNTASTVCREQTLRWEIATARCRSREIGGTPREGVRSNRSPNLLLRFPSATRGRTLEIQKRQVARRMHRKPLMRPARLKFKNISR